MYDEQAFQEFKAAARFSISGREVYLVEGDIVLDDAAELREYYEKRFGLHEKSIVNMVAGVRDVRVDNDTTTDVVDITFCFDNSSWGGTEVGDSDGDTVFNEPLPSKADTLAQIQRGMRSWEGVANVRFTYLAASDGANCGAIANVVITLNTSSNCTATGAFPSSVSQQFTVPICGVPGNLAQHEVGHVLGFRHEHIHSNDPNACSEGGTQGTDYEELFANVDRASAMIYFECNNGPDGLDDFGPDGVPDTPTSPVIDDPVVQDDLSIANNLVSRLDGIGAREIYGPPQWWWGGLL
jgi:hypothetical protein